ncbi:hypothetical protein [Marinobacter sp. OP 3.4]|uniref:hypothetical protein n=1 Tax=Marinobacter sp. OP 3.4 TaxID=3076501 RepID=UPI002E1FF513
MKTVERQGWRDPSSMTAMDGGNADFAGAKIGQGRTCGACFQKSYQQAPCPEVAVSQLKAETDSEKRPDTKKPPEGGFDAGNPVD